MVGWHHLLKGHAFEQAPGVGDEQGSLACCSRWGHKESEKTEQLNWSEPAPYQISTSHPSSILLILFLPFLSSSHQSLEFSAPFSPVFGLFFLPLLPHGPYSWFSVFLICCLISVCVLQQLVSFMNFKGNVESQNHQRPLETFKSASTWCYGTRTKRSWSSDKHHEDRPLEGL